MVGGSVIERGAKFISGSLESGQLVLTREDGTTALAPVIAVRGHLVDNGDGTWDIEEA